MNIINESLRMYSVLEYNQDITAKNYGKGLLKAYTNQETHSDGTRELTKDIVESDYNTSEYSHIVKAILGELEDADPTPNKSYVPFLAKLYSTDPKVYMYAIQVFGKSYLRTYDTAKSKNILEPQDKDIMRIKTLVDLKLLVDKYEDKLYELDIRSKGNENAETVYEDNDVRVIIPYDEEASCYYGKGSTWCTSATKSTNAFNTYKNRGVTLYILLPKKPEHANEKYQLCFETGEYKDESNSQINIIKLLTQRFSDDVYKFFKNRYPTYLTRNLAAAINLDRSTMEDICSSIYYYVFDNHIKRQLSITMLSDKEYVKYLTNKTASKTEDDVDWDRVSEDIDSYLDFNGKLNYVVRDIKKHLMLASEQLEDLISMNDENLRGDGEGRVTLISDIPYLLAQNLESLGYHEYDDGEHDESVEANLVFSTAEYIDGSIYIEYEEIANRVVYQVYASTLGGPDNIILQGRTIL